MDYEREIRLVREAGVWVALDVDAGVSAHGGTREGALSNLDAAVEGSDGVGVSGPDDLVRELDVEPEELRNTEDV